MTDLVKEFEEWYLSQGTDGDFTQSKLSKVNDEYFYTVTKLLYKQFCQIRKLKEEDNEQSISALRTALCSVTKTILDMQWKFNTSMGDDIVDYALSALAKTKEGEPKNANTL